MKIIISNSSNEPIYQQIVSQLKEQILKGQLTAGEALPSIRGLAKELQISVITTKRLMKSWKGKDLSRLFLEKVLLLLPTIRKCLKKKNWL